MTLDRRKMVEKTKAIGSVRSIIKSRKFNTVTLAHISDTELGEE